VEGGADFGIDGLSSADSSFFREEPTELIIP
jgi:hypothetical protein